MTTPQEKQQELPTIWHISDELWMLMAPLLAQHDPPKRRGRKRIDPRAALDAIIFRLRSGCQWNHLPQAFPDDSSVHRTFQRWIHLGIFEYLWATLVSACADLGDLNWEWQAADGAMRKARLSRDLIGPHPTDCGKNGTKRSLLVEADGVPLAVVVAGANVLDTQLLDATLGAIVIQRPESTSVEPQHLCLDKGYDHPKFSRSTV